MIYQYQKHQKHQGRTLGSNTPLPEGRAILLIGFPLKNELPRGRLMPVFAFGMVPLDDDGLRKSNGIGTNLPRLRVINYHDVNSRCVLPILCFHWKMKTITPNELLLPPVVRSILNYSFFRSTVFSFPQISIFSKNQDTSSEIGPAGSDPTAKRVSSELAVPVQTHGRK